jgi:hypothetical protein
MTQAEAPFTSTTPTPTGQQTQGSAFAQAKATTLGVLNSVTGGALDSNPADWTPEEAASQTDRALARIGAVNPELAQKLQAQRTGQEAPSGHGFLGSLMHGVGEVLKITHLDQVLNILSRPARILPEMLADEEHQSVWGNMAQALAGHSDKGWGQVLDQRNILTGHDIFSRVAHQGLALIGDVATDPLTYVTLGAGAVSKEILGTSASKLVTRLMLEDSPEGLRILTAGGRTARDGMDILWQKVLMGEPLKEGATLNETIVKRLVDAGVSRDAIPGLSTGLASDLEKDAILKAFRAGNTTWNMVSGRSAGAFSRGSADLAKALGVPEEVTKAAVAELRGRIKAGTGFGIKKSVYEQGRAAQGLLSGGVKLRGSIPGFNIRFLTNAIPGTNGLNFQIARRFTAGMSGYNRLGKMVVAGEATADHWAAFMQGGFKGLMEYDAPVAHKLAGGTFSGHGGSFLYPMSDMVGGFTANLSAHAKLLRGGGLGELIAANTYRTALSKREAVSSAVLEVADETGKVMTPKDVQLKYLDLFDIKAARKDPLKVAMMWGHLQDYLRLVPTDEAQNMGARAFWDARAAETEALGGEQSAELAAFFRAKGDEAVAAETALRGHGEKTLEGARLHRKVVQQGRDTLLRNGIYDAVHATMGDHVHAMNQLDATAWAKTGHEVTQGTTWALDQPELLDHETGLIGEESLTNGFVGEPVGGTGGPLHTAHGYNAHEVTDQSPDLVSALAKQEGGGVIELTPAETKALTDQTAPPMVGRLLNPIVRDLRGTKNTDALDIVKDIEAQSREALDVVEANGGGAEAIAKELPEGLDPAVKKILSEEIDRADKVGQMVSARLQSMGHDGIVTIDEKGVKHATFFHDPKGPQVLKYITEDAPRAADDTFGQLIHQLTPGVLRAVKGDGVDGAVKSDQFLRSLSRKLVGKSLKEAELEARRVLDERGIQLRPNQAVFETDPLKVVSSFANEIGSRVTNKYLGRAARRIDRYGLNDSPFRGAAVGIEKYRYIIADGDFGALAETAKEVQDASRRTAQLAVKLAPFKSVLAEASAKVDELHHRVESEVGQLHGVIEDDLTQQIRLHGKVLKESETEVNATLKRTEEDLAVARAAPDSELARAHTDIKYRVHQLEEGVVRLDSVTTTASGKEYLDTRYLVERDGKVVAQRSVTGKNVLAVVHKDARRNGLGSLLLHQHWSDAGVFAAKDPVAAAKKLIESQTFSEEGAALNHAAVNHLMDWADAENPLVKEAARARGEVDKLMGAHSEAVREWNRAQAELTTKSAKVQAALVPAENAANMTGFTALQIPGMTEHAMPSFMAEEFNRASAGFKSLNGFHVQYRQFMSWWKTWATYMFPGFHARNFMGAWFNNWLGGVTVQDYVLASRMRRAARELVSGGDKWRDVKIMSKDAEHLREMGIGKLMSEEAMKHLTYSDLASLVSDMGMNSSHGRAFAEAVVGTEAVEDALTKQKLFEHIPVLGKPYVKAARGAGTLTENLFRTASWIRGMKNTGGDIWGARAFTMMRHGDYADLTDWEYGWVRDLIPFYKWMRTNTPFQIHQLFESPGKLLGVQKFQSAAFGVAGRDWNKEKYKEPQWMRDSMQLPLPGGKDGALNVVMLDLPMHDLFKSSKEYVSSFLPLIRPFLESYVFKQDTFTGRPIGSKEVPLSPWFAPVAPILKAVGLTKGGAEGGNYVSESTQNILNAVPVFSRFRNWMYDDPKKVSLRGNALASAIFGVSPRSVDESSMTQAELDFYYNNIQPQITYLQSLGYPLPTTADLKQAYGDSSTVLTGLGITPGGVAAQGG